MTLISCMATASQGCLPSPVTRKSNSLPQCAVACRRRKSIHLLHHGGVVPCGQHWRIRRKLVTFALDSTQSKWQSHCTSCQQWIWPLGGGRRFKVVAADEPLPPRAVPDVAPTDSTSAVAVATPPRTDVMVCMLHLDPVKAGSLHEWLVRDGRCQLWVGQQGVYS